MVEQRTYWAGRAHGQKQAGHRAEQEIRELTNVVTALTDEVERLRSIALTSADPSVDDPWVGRS